jgi:hypothetical protein
MNPSERIDQLIAELTDWRGKTLASVRKTILEADREIIEEWKWMGSPVWSRDGIIAARQRPQREGEADLFPRGEPPGPWHGTNYRHQLFLLNGWRSVLSQSSAGNFNIYHQSNITMNNNPWSFHGTSHRGARTQLTTERHLNG